MKKRLFIAFELPNGIKDKLKLIPQNNLRVVPSENIHITLLFIGYTDEENITEINKVLNKVAVEQKPFRIKFKEMIFAPPNQQCRMIWALFEKSIEFEKLSNQLAGELKEFNPDFRKEKLVHITLARFRKPLSKKELEYIKLPDNLIEDIKIEKITLFESILKQGGPIYTKLYEAPFLRN